LPGKSKRRGRVGEPGGVEAKKREKRRKAPDRAPAPKSTPRAFDPVHEGSKRKRVKLYQQVREKGAEKKEGIETTA